MRTGSDVLNLADAAFETSVFEPQKLFASDRPEIVFSGRSNVGKSSLINKIFNRKSLARVSSAPGKTASINFYTCSFEGESVHFVDLPGYGFARVSKETKARWSELVERYFAGERRIALVIQLIDSRHSPTEYDRQMLGFLRENGLPFAAALTKCDKLKKKSERAARGAEFDKAFSEFGPFPYVMASAETGEGIETLQQMILQHIRQEKSRVE